VGLTSPAPRTENQPPYEQDVDNHDIASPSMDQFKNVDPKNIPYWSPATKLSYANIESSNSNSNLAASAREFVPTFGSSSSTSTDAPTSSSEAAGMNSSANEWRPPSSLLPEEHDEQPEPPVFHSSEQEDQTEPLVEVAWNGGVYVVPASMAFGVGELTHQQQQQVQPASFDGMEWCTHWSSLPTARKRSLQTIGIPEPIRQHFQSLDLDALRQMDPEDERYKEIPTRFHSACPLDDPAVHRGAGGSFGYPSSLYKVVDRADSQLYTLRRFDNVRSITSSVLSNTQATWSAVRHPSIVSLYSISTEKGAVFFAHAFHPSAQTLQQRFMNPKTTSASVPVGESLLWRLLSQLLAGVRHVHSRHMAIRSISPSHVLLTSGARFRIANVGVVDVLEFESRKSLGDMQLGDLYCLGVLVLSVATRSSMGNSKAIESGMSLLQQHYSQDLYQAVAALLSGSRNADQMCQMVCDKMCDELDFALASSDALHLNLQNEYENGRLLRLLLKLGYINERPEHALSPSWSETGDRYVLKLFRDYVFHQTNLDGVPQIDTGHVVTSLNKLDMADPEKILLSSRNGKDVFVASFYDINRCLDMAFVDLTQQAGRSMSQQQQSQSHHQLPAPPHHLRHTQHAGSHRGGQGGRGSGMSMGMGADHSQYAGDMGRGGRGGGGKGRGGGKGGGHYYQQQQQQQQYLHQQHQGGPFGSQLSDMY